MEKVDKSLTQDHKKDKNKKEKKNGQPDDVKLAKQEDKAPLRIAALLLDFLIEKGTCSSS